MSTVRTHITNKTWRKATNLTLSRSARWYAGRLKKRLAQRSLSAVVELILLREAERIGLKKSNGVQHADEVKVVA